MDMVYTMEMILSINASIKLYEYYESVRNLERQLWTQFSWPYKSKFIGINLEGNVCLYYSEKLVAENTAEYLSLIIHSLCIVAGLSSVWDLNLYLLYWYGISKQC